MSGFLNRPDLLGPSFITSAEIGKKINRWLIPPSFVDVYSQAQNKNKEDGMLYIGPKQKTLEFKQRQNYIFEDTIRKGGVFPYSDIQIPSSNLAFLRDVYLIYDLGMRYTQAFRCDKAVTSDTKVKSGRGYFRGAYVPIAESFLFDLDSGDVYIHNGSKYVKSQYGIEEVLNNFF